MSSCTSISVPLSLKLHMYSTLHVAWNSHIERELTSPFLFSGNQGSTILCTMLCGLPARHRVYTGIWKETLLGLQVSGVQRRVAGNLVSSYFPFPTGEGRLMNMATSSSPGAIAKLLVNS